MAITLNAIFRSEGKMFFGKAANKPGERRNDNRWNRRNQYFTENLPAECITVMKNDPAYHQQNDGKNNKTPHWTDSTVFVLFKH